MASPSSSSHEKKQLDRLHQNKKAGSGSMAQSPEGLCWPAVWDSTAPLQPKSESGPCAVEDILPWFV